MSVPIPSRTRLRLGLAAVTVTVAAAIIPAVSSQANQPNLGQPQPVVVLTAANLTAQTTALTRASRAAGYHSVPQTRLYDSRSLAGRLSPGELVTIPVAGNANVQATNATAVVLNFTATEALSGGYVTVAPCGAAISTTSTVNYLPGTDVANLAIVGLGTGGAVCVTASTPTHLVVDVTGWFGSGGDGFNPIAPARLSDTRTANGHARVPAASLYRLQVAGQADLPTAGVSAVALNVTATETTAAGYVGVRSCSAPRAGTSNLNVAAGGTASNAVIAAVDSDGQVCLSANTTTHLVIDVVGWFGPNSGASFDPIAPRRIVDTRTSHGAIPTGGILELAFLAQSAVALNVTVPDPQTAGFLTIWPCDATRPTTSSVNYRPGAVIANAVQSAVATNGKLCIYASQSTQVVVDQTGVYTQAPGTPTDGTGGTPPSSSNAGAIAIAWARTQIGDRYASINPYRFGDSSYGKAWDCPTGQLICSRTDMFGAVRSINSGSFAYDCSGLIVAAWLRASVDLVKTNASWTDPMYDQLPHVTRGEARPGDIVLFDYGTTSDRTDHAGMFISDTQMIHAGSCTGYDGVCLRAIDWTHVVAIARPQSR